MTTTDISNARTTIVYSLRYLGHTIDQFDSQLEAEEGRRRLVADIRAGKCPNFLDADDISGVADFTIFREMWLDIERSPRPFSEERVA